MEVGYKPTTFYFVEFASLTKKQGKFFALHSACFYHL